MNTSPSSASKHNRRSFLKAQAIIALGTCTTGIGISEANASSSKPESSGAANAQLANYSRLVSACKIIDHPPIISESYRMQP